MKKVEEAELGVTEKSIATKDTYWFQYVVAFSGENDNFFSRLNLLLVKQLLFN